MRLITELTFDVEQKCVIEEGTDGKSKRFFIEGVFMQAGITNRNGRVYPSEILAKQVDAYTLGYVKEQRAFGELGHPAGPSINLDRVSHRIVELRREGNDFYGKAQISTTPMGNIVRGLIEDGGKLGVSSRGMGTLKKNSQGVMEVQDDFYLATAGDVVADPSAPSAFVNGIMEGREWIWNNGLLQEREVQSLKDQIEEQTRARRLNEGAMLKAFMRLAEGSNDDAEKAHKLALDHGCSQAVAYHKYGHPLDNAYVKGARDAEKKHGVHVDSDEIEAELIKRGHVKMVKK